MIAHFVLDDCSAKLCDPCTLSFAYVLQPLRLETSFASFFLKHWHASPVDFSVLPCLTLHTIPFGKHSMLKRKLLMFSTVAMPEKRKILKNEDVGATALSEFPTTLATAFQASQQPTSPQSPPHSYRLRPGYEYITISFCEIIEVRDQETYDLNGIPERSYAADVFFHSLPP